MTLREWEKKEQCSQKGLGKVARPVGGEVQKCIHTYIYGAGGMVAASRKREGGCSSWVKNGKRA